MHRIATYVCFFTLVMFTKYAVPKNNMNNMFINKNVVENLSARGIKVYGPINDFKQSVFPDSNNINGNREILKLSVSKSIPDAKKRAIPPKLNSLNHLMDVTSSVYDTIMVDDFETGFIDENKWNLGGDPTWGATDYNGKPGLVTFQPKGNYSAWCAAARGSATVPNEKYPNNMNSELIFGPFNLSDINYGELNFSYWLDTQIQKDWFSYMVSIDGENFSGVAISGYNGPAGGSWDEDFLPFSNVPNLGDITGNSEVWVAFSFESESVTTGYGVFVDNISIT